MMMFLEMYVSNLGRVPMVDLFMKALLLCFKLQDSRVSVVSSTAAATLRQAVMLIFNRVSSSIPSTPTTIPLPLPSHPPQTVEVTPSALDAFNIFSDLCLLAATAGSHGSAFSLWKGGDKEKPKLLKLNTLQRTFALELIESILSGYEDGVKKVRSLFFQTTSFIDVEKINLAARVTVPPPTLSSSSTPQAVGRKADFPYSPSCLSTDIPFDPFVHRPVTKGE